MIFIRRACALAAAALLVVPGFADEPATARPKVVLVLSGGGARGIAHIGVLKVLEEYHVPVDMVVGTSMGSIVGGLYASGWTTEEIETMVTTIDWGSVFVDRVPRRYRTYRRKQDDIFLVPIKMRFKNWKPYLPPSVVGGQRLELLMQGFEIEGSATKDFDKFPIPYRAVAADLATGKAVILDHGSLSTAMRASMSVPGIFPPVEIDGRPLCDGGVAANYPIEIARSFGAEVVIGVDITSPLSEKSARGNLIQRLDQMSSLLTNAHKADDLAAATPADILMTPSLGDLGFADFARAEEAIAAGEAAARGAAERLKALAVSDEAWAAYVARHHRRPASDLIVDEVRVVNTSFLDTRLVEKRLPIPLGEPLDEANLADQVLKLHSLDTFGTIHHDLNRVDGKNVLTIETPRKPYGRNSLQFGFDFEDDFHGAVTFNLSVSHLLNPLNRLGGEWRNVLQIGDNSVLGTELFQPLDTAMAWFTDVRAATRRDKFLIYDADGDALAEYLVRTSDVRVGFGRVFKNWGQWQVGAFRSYSKAEPRIAVPGFGDVDVNDGGAYAAAHADTLDSFTWPRKGLRIDAEYAYALESMGADVEGSSVRFAGGSARSFGKNVLFGSVEVGHNPEGPESLATSILLGGFLRLSGLHPNELIGPEGGLARIMYYRELSSFTLGSLTQRMYAGASFEIGNIYQTGDPVTWPSLRRSGSVFVGADTVLGPAYLGYGYSEGGRDAVYLIIGQRF